MRIQSSSFTNHNQPSPEPELEYCHNHGSRKTLASYVLGLVCLFPGISLPSHIFALVCLCPRMSLPLHGCPGLVCLPSHIESDISRMRNISRESSSWSSLTITIGLIQALVQSSPVEKEAKGHSHMHTVTYLQMTLTNSITGAQACKVCHSNSSSSQRPRSFFRGEPPT